MRKSGPLRSIRVCAYTALGADSGVTEVTTAGDDAPADATTGAGALAGVDDLRCHNTHTSRNVGAAMRRMRRTRMHIPSMGTVISTDRPRKNPTHPASVARVTRVGGSRINKMRIQGQRLITLVAR